MQTDYAVLFGYPEKTKREREGEKVEKAAPKTNPSLLGLKFRRACKVSKFHCVEFSATSIMISRLVYVRLLQNASEIPILELNSIL